MLLLLTASWTPLGSLLRSGSGRLGKPHACIPPPVLWAFPAPACLPYTFPCFAASSPCLLRGVSFGRKLVSICRKQPGCAGQEETTNLSCRVTFKKTKERLLVHCSIERRHTSLRIVPQVGTRSVE